MENNQQPATKADVQAVDAKVTALDTKVSALDAKVSALDAKVSALDERAEILRSAFHHAVDDLKETMRDSQTELLKAFYSFTESHHKRVGQLEMNESAVVSRLGTLEGRMLELERKVNFPNHPRP